MGLWSFGKKTAGFFFNVRVDQWLNFPLLKNTFKSTTQSAADLLKKNEARQEETYDEALINYHLSEKDINARKKEFARLFTIYIIIALLIFSYAIYIIINGNFWGFFIAFALTLYALAQAFKYHFWLFQIKQKKLGCTFREWLNSDSNTNSNNDSDKLEKK